jgi:hypothetical protein
MENPNGSSAAFGSSMNRGMSKREYLAAMALQGLLSQSVLENHFPYVPATVARMAVNYADALLAKLEEANA